MAAREHPAHGDPPSWATRELSFEPVHGEGELSVQRNCGSETRNIVLSQSFLPGEALAVVRGVSHGSYNGKPACMLLLQFQFRATRLPFKKAEVFVEFTQMALDIPQAAPIVRIVSPCQVYGGTTTENIEETSEGGAQASASAGPVSAGVDARRSKTSMYEKNHALEITGMPWLTDNTHDDYDTVIWDVTENKKSEGHLPVEFTFGVVVERSHGIQATVTLKINGSRSLAWKKDDPLLLPMNGQEKGLKPSQREFEQLDDSDWKRLVPYREEGKTIISGKY